MSMTRVAILGVGAYSPEAVISNADLEKIVDTNDQWIVQRTGIRERRRAAPDELTSDLALKAALRALDQAGTTPAELDLIIVATVTPDHPFPSTACFVQEKLGAKKGPAFDLSAACGGFLYGLGVGEKFVRCGDAQRVLVVGVELLSRFVDYQDRNTCVLFGDGAGAVVLGPSSDPERGILSCHLGADGAQAETLTVPAGGSRSPASEETVASRQHYLQMDGRAVFRHAVRRLSEYAKLAVESNGLSTDDVDLVVAHQANVRILESVAQRCGLPMDRFWMNIERFGNTSSASVPIVLDEAVRANAVKPGDTLLLLAMGAGFTYGSALVRW